MSPAAATTDLDSLVRRRIDAWHQGQDPDTAAVLSDHPELHGEKSLVLDLILEEYCLRTAAGDTLVKSTFCDRFLARMASLEAWADANSEILAVARESKGSNAVGELLVLF